ncbi:RNA polymerase sigma factor SigW [Bacillaceae bacterium]
MAEADLIKAAKEGDRDALIQLLREIEIPVYRTAYYLLGNEHDAMDASQEALIRIYTRIRSFEEKAKFSTWVQRIVTNVCIDKLRKKNETYSIDEYEIEIRDDNDVEKVLERKAAATEIREAIEQLPEHHRTVVILRYIQEFSYHEIAETLGLPLNTVKSYLYRARQRLQTLLGDYQKGGVRG